MISLVVLFWMFVILFAVIGGTRGRTKEFLVALSAVVAIFLNTLLEEFVPNYNTMLAGINPNLQFFIRFGILAVITILGYITPSLPKLNAIKAVPPSRIRDVFWGLAFGALNGYLIFGTAWYYLHQAGYPFSIITAPDANSVIGAQALAMIDKLPPEILTPPGLYFAIAIAFVFVLGAFV